MIGQNQLLSKIAANAEQSNRSMVSLANEKAAALQQPVLHANLNGQTIEKRKSVDSTGEVAAGNNSGGVVTIKKGGRMPSRKLEPLAQDNHNAKESGGGGANKTKVSPFLGGGLGGQSQTIVVVENANATISNLSLGLPARHQ